MSHVRTNDITTNEFGQEETSRGPYTGQRKEVLIKTKGKEKGIGSMKFAPNFRRASEQDF